MSGSDFGGGYGYGRAPYGPYPPGGYPPLSGGPGGYPPPPGGPGGYPPTPGGYYSPPGGCPSSSGRYSPSNRGFGWYNWERPSHCSGEFYWVRSDGGYVPPNAVHAGRDRDGGPLYAGRAYYEGDLLPAKVAPFLQHAMVSWRGREHHVYQFEVLCSHHVAWAEDGYGRVPPNAMVIGQTCEGENLFMGRTMHEGNLTPGKIQPSHGCLYIPFHGHELKYYSYEVLCLN